MLERKQFVNLLSVFSEKGGYEVRGGSEIFVSYRLLDSGSAIDCRRDADAVGVVGHTYKIPIGVKDFFLSKLNSG